MLQGAQGNAKQKQKANYISDNEGLLASYAFTTSGCRYSSHQLLNEADRRVDYKYHTCLPFWENT